ncbi:MAG: hypothetical protein ACHQAY_22845 [Hyphomicrobiales bacterium]
MGLALAAGMAIATLQPSAAMAQFWGYGSWYGRAPWAPAPAYPRAYDEERLRPGEIVDLLRGYGWTILSPPTLSGPRYVANVRTAFGQRLFVVLDAYDGRLLRSRPLDERPDTSALAAIPGAAAPRTPFEESIRPSVPEPVSPAPRVRRPAPQAKRVLPAPIVKSAPLAPPAEKDGTVAAVKPTAAPPAAKLPVPAPAAPMAKGTPPEPGSPDGASAPVVRQVYPAGEGAPASAPTPAAPQSAAVAAPVAPSSPPAKPPQKAALPPDAGYE